MQKVFLLVLMSFLWAGCRQAKEKNLPQTIASLRQTGELVTVQYTLSKIIKANDNKTWYKIGNRKILMSCEAYVKAGVNLQGLTEKNFVATDSTLTVTLPHARIFSLNVPADKIQVAYQEVSGFRDPFSAAEREALLAQAETQLKVAAGNMDIVKKAEENATIFLQSLLQQAPYKTVNILFAP